MLPQITDAYWQTENRRQKTEDRKPRKGLWPTGQAEDRKQMTDDRRQKTHKRNQRFLTGQATVEIRFHGASRRQKTDDYRLLGN